MKCTAIRLPDGTGAIVCGGRAPAARCQWPGCRSPHVRLCDYAVDKGTCDLRLCKRHSVHVGADRDLCPDHAELEAKQLELELTDRAGTR